VIPSLRRNEPERETMLASLGALYVRGAGVDWRALHPGGSRPVPLPRYPWQRERHWMEPMAELVAPARPAGPHPLLGAHQRLAHLPSTHLWETVAGADALARLGVNGDGTIPPRVLGDAARAAAAQAVGPGAHAVAELRSTAPLVLSGGPVTVQLTLTRDEGEARFAIHARPAAGRADDPWTLHAEGTLLLGAPELEAEEDAAPGLQALPVTPPLPTRAQIAAAGPAERAALLEAYLCARAAAVLRMPAERIDADRAATGLGLDSLMAVELKNAVERDLGAQVPLRDLLAGASLRALAAALVPRVSIEAEPDGEADGGAGEGEAPLSYAQRPMWLLHQLDPFNGVFNVFAALTVTPAPDAAALRRALTALVERHPALRTAFPARDGRPVQEVREGVEVDLPEVDAAAWSDDELRRRLEDEAHRPFDLERAPLLRAGLYRRGGSAVLLLAMHHAAVDFWSNVLLLDDLGALYPAERGGAPAPPPPRGAPFTAWAREQERALAGPEGERMWAYWRERLAGASPALALPAERRAAPRTAAGGVHHFRMGAERTRRLHVFAEEQGATLYTALLAAWHALLHRWTRQDDVLVASPMAARGPAWEGTVGCFMNLVLLRGDLSAQPGFATLLRRTRDTVLGALENQSYPLHLLAERIPALRDASTAAPAQAMFVFNRPHRLEEAGIAGVMAGEPGFAFTAGGLVMEALPLDERTTPADLCLWACEAAGDLSMRLQYAADLFTPAAAERMAGQLRALVDAVLADPERPVAHAPLLSAAERSAALALAVGDAPVADASVLVHHAFAAQAARTPDAPALAADAETVSYAELDARANRLAHHLVSLGVRPEARVGVCLERGPELIVALLAVLKAGAAYLPLDPAYPDERLEQMLEDAGATVLVGQGARRLGGPRLARVRVDADRAAIAAHPPTDPGVAVEGGNLAYVIYTSGSTGRPKGTMITHAALANHTASAAAAYGVEAGDRMLQFASASFDASAEEIYPTLARGACLVLRPEWATGSAADFFRFCREARLTLLDLPTAFWHTLAAAIAAGEGALPECVRLLIIGGERALPERVAQWSAGVGSTCILVNTYGPTEATIVATRHVVKPEDAGAREVPIGRAIHGATARVLDGALQPVPAGVPGELFVGGAGVARGYLGRPALTAERFVPDPFSTVPGARMYATGDLARVRGDGALEFAGRIDPQVKVRGYRIEPGEVEAALREHPDVADAAVAAPERAPGERRLVAWVVPHRAPAPPQRELREFLGELLPAHMVPASILFVRELPLTPSGKLDRRALLAMESPAAAADEAYVAPATPLETLLAEVWASVLGRERVGVRDSFFELGGDSIGAMQVVARARKAGLVVEPRLLFAHPTIARLAAALGSVPDPEPIALDPSTVRTLQPDAEAAPA
ncbi:MAG TPA: amino acid adenylation domain-containing protein, partial [Longimicrobium sp.]|nr:amino acid adenylation domain-containing protein [Longimicrobium sp.]